MTEVSPDFNSRLIQVQDSFAFEVHVVLLSLSFFDYPQGKAAENILTAISNGSWIWKLLAGCAYST